jgi:hypothetical protein
MQVLQGHSKKAGGLEAVAEATEGWPDAALDLVMVFTSTAQDPGEVARALRERFGATPVVGCTTAGELLGKEHYNGALVVMGLVTPRIRWATATVEDLATFDEGRARVTGDLLLGRLGVSRDDVDPRRHFALLFVDGLSGKEESISSLMADALEGMPLVGGSAGDDLKFQRTHVYGDGKAIGSAAVFAVADCAVPFEIVKHQHFTTTPRALVVTRADLAERRVYEMDGYPAVEAYARALGLPVSAITGDVSFMNPLAFVCNGEIYVRSVQRVDPDGSMVFFCAIEEGMVLSIGGHEEMIGALKRDVAGVGERVKDADLFIACNCILRALEADRGHHHPSLGEALQGLGKNVIGFDTYGEQLSGLHFNQTLVGIAIRDQQPPGSA